MGLENGIDIDAPEMDERKKLRLSVKCAQFQEVMLARGASAEEASRKVAIFRKMVITKEAIVARLDAAKRQQEEQEEDQSHSDESERSPTPKKRSRRRRRRRRRRSPTPSDKDDDDEDDHKGDRREDRPSRDGAEPPRPHPKPSLLGTPPPHAQFGGGMSQAFHHAAAGGLARGRGRGAMHSPHVGGRPPPLRPPSLMSQNSGAASLLNSGALGALNRPDLSLADRDKIAAALIDDEAELMARELAKTARGRAEVVEKKRGIRRTLIGGSGGNNIIGHPGHEGPGYPSHGFSHADKVAKKHPMGSQAGGGFLNSTRPLRPKPGQLGGHHHHHHGGSRGHPSHGPRGRGGLHRSYEDSHGPPNMSNKLPGIKANLIGPRGNPWRWAAAAESAASRAEAARLENRPLESSSGPSPRFSRSPPPTHHRSAFNRGSRSRSRSGSRSRY